MRSQCSAFPSHSHLKRRAAAERELSWRSGKRCVLHPAGRLSYASQGEFVIVSSESQADRRSHHILSSERGGQLTNRICFLDIGWKSWDSFPDGDDLAISGRIMSCSSCFRMVCGAVPYARVGLYQPEDALSREKHDNRHQVCPRHLCTAAYTSTNTNGPYRTMTWSL
jgi:hypothetical protein